jgi:hypothetical protein
MLSSLVVKCRTMHLRATDRVQNPRSLDLLGDLDGRAT